MEKFPVDMSELLRQLTQTTDKIKGVGRELDKLDDNTRNSARTMAEFGSSVSKALSGFERELTKSRSETEGLSQSFERLRSTTESALNAIISRHHTATITAGIYADKTSELNRLLTQTDGLNQQIQTHQKLNKMQNRAVYDTRLLQEEIKLLNSVEEKEAGTLRKLVAAKKAARDSEAQISAEIIKTQAALDGLNTKEAATLRTLQTKKKVLEENANASNKQVLELNRLKIASENYDSAVGRSIQQAKTELAVKRVKTQVDSAQAVALAKERAKLDESYISRQKTIDALRQEENVRKAVNRELEKAAVKEARLRAQLDTMKTGAGRTAVMLQAEIKAEEKAILASTAAIKEKTKNLRLGQQMTASMRAGLQGLKTSIGMYTSATIIAASATYAFTRVLRSSIEVGAEFTTQMARTRAIMSSSAGASETVFDALEKRVRALGQTTSFTASQVADAVTELGQAGLSAGQAMTALQPTLDLAIIGNLSMASSADHATNIMMIFGKQVGDLTDIVDVMAMAVTNSNTNIDQLANALTYAGPAAHTAGISMRDTAAAVSALANSGFKASRSGTALRRFFVSILNPTKKGQAMLDKYNISVLDLEGNTRDLTDILGQLDNALKNVSGAERLSAIQDLVGVYATSPIAALVGQTENFNALRTQFEFTADAAEKMRKKIEDSISFDFREAKSAFQELQLTIFKENEHQMRIWVQELVGFFNHLGEIVEGGATRLEVYATRIKNVGIAIGAFIALSKLNNFRRTLIAESAALATNTKSLQAKHAAMVRAGATTNILRGASLKNIVEINRETAAINSQSAAWSRLAVVRSQVARGATWLGAAATTLGVWGVALWGAYEVLSSMFGSNNEIERGMTKHEGKVVSLKEKYDALKTSAREANEARLSKSLKEQSDMLTSQIVETSEKLGTYITMQESMNKAGVKNDFIESSIILLKKEQKDLVDTIANVNTEQAKLNKAKVEEAQITTRVLEIAKEIEEQEKKITYARKFARPWQEVEAKQKILELSKELLKVTEKQVKAESDLAQVLRLSAERIQAPFLRAKKEAAEEDLTVSQKYAAAQKDMTEANKEYAEAVRLANEAVLTGVGNQQELTNRLQAAEAWVGRASVSLFKFSREMKDVNKSVAEAELALELLDLSEQEQLTRIQKEIKKVIALREHALSLRAMDSPDFNAEEYIELTKKLTDLESKRKRLMDSISKGSGRGGRQSDEARKAEQSLKEAKTAFENLRKEYDSTGHAQAEFQKGVKQLDLLLKSTTITAEEHSSAMQQLRKNHYEALKSGNELQKLAIELRDSHLNNSFGKAADDMWKLTRAVNAGTLSLQEQEAILRKLARTREDSLKSSLPKVDFQQTNNTGPFLDHLKFLMDSSRDRDVFTKTKTDDLDQLSEQLIAWEHEREERRAHLELVYQDELMYKQKLGELNQEYIVKEQEAIKEKNSRLAIMEKQRLQWEEQNRMLSYASFAGSLGDTLGLIASASEDATSIQKVAFAAQKALAVAQIILQTHVAAANAQAITDTFLGMSLSAAIMAQGYASAGLVAGMAIGELSGGSKGFAGMYDKGGYIPAGQYGIVGEYGPEIVNGPAHVTGREETARKLGSGGDKYVFAPEINIEYKSEGNTETDRENAIMMGNTIKTIVLATIKDQLRPNGLLGRK